MIKVFRNIDLLSHFAAQLFVMTSRNAVHDRGQFVVALSGGHSPRPVFKLLAEPNYRDRVPWENTFVLWSDERYVPLDDKRSNAGAAYDLLLKHVPIPEYRILTMYDKKLNLNHAAEEYESLLKGIFEQDQPRLDLTFLGCGEDGHTASLFPGSPVLHERDALIRAVDSSEHEAPRITMTPRLLNNSHSIVVIAYGKNKAEIIKNILEEPEQTDKFPIQAVKPLDGTMYWLIDSGAASKLQNAYDI